MLRHQDWNTVVIKGKHGQTTPRDQASRDPTNSVKKFNAGKNKNTTNDLTQKLDTDEIVAPPTVSRTLSQQILQARQAKGWTQKELAQKIAEKPDIIRDYESGKAIPNQKIINKLQRALSVTFTNHK